MTKRLPSPALLAGLAALLAAQALGLDLASSGSTIAACVAIGVFGLPHGTFDLQLIQRERGERHGLARLAVLYIGCGAAMFALWRIDALLALLAFLMIAVAHFAEDWPEIGSGFLAAGLAAALLCAPAFLHHAELAVIFDAMTASDATGATGKGALVADALLLVAPVACALAAVAMAVLFQAGRDDLGGGALLALILLPPAVGFALFFCLLHSPRHFAAGIERLAWHRAAQWLPVAVPLTLTASTFGVGLYLLQAPGAVDDNMTAATFILLSVLTVPHMLVPVLVDWGARSARPLSTAPSIAAASRRS